MLDFVDTKNWELQLPTKGKFDIVSLPGFNGNCYCEKADGCLVLTVPADGGTSKNSIHPRTEFRQINNGKRLNWSTGKATMSIEKLPIVNPIVCFAQVKLESGPAGAPLMIFIKNKQIFLKTFKGEQRFTITKTYELGTRFTFCILVDNGKISVFYENLTTPVFEFFDDHDDAYFKVGNYMQSSVAKGELPETTSVVHVYKLILECR